jgi:hypothetical protein
MKASFESKLLGLCAVLLCASSAWANIANPGGAKMPPAPPVTVSLGGSSEAAPASAPIAVVKSFPSETSVLHKTDGASLFWLGLLCVLGVSLFGTGVALIARSARVEMVPAAAVRATRTMKVRTPVAV